MGTDCFPFGFGQGQAGCALAKTISVRSRLRSGYRLPSIWFVSLSQRVMAPRPDCRASAAGGWLAKTVGRRIVSLFDCAQGQAGCALAKTGGLRVGMASKGLRILRYAQEGQTVWIQAFAGIVCMFESTCDGTSPRLLRLPPGAEWSRKDKYSGYRLPSVWLFVEALGHGVP